MKIWKCRIQTWMQMMLAFLFLCGFANAREKFNDVVETKNGNTYICRILEQIPNDKVTIQLQGGSKLTIPYDNIQKIRKVTTEEIPGYQEHKGFFLSLSTGPGYIGTKADYNVTYFAYSNLFDKVKGTISMSAFAFPFEFKIGGTPVENIIISADFAFYSGVSMSIDKSSDDGSDFESFLSSAFYGFNSSLVGLGLTYYFMPENIFVSVTGGMNIFTASIDEGNGYGENEVELIEATGFGMQIKTGKEWWVSKRWGIGISAFYHFGIIGNGDIKKAPFSKTITNCTGICFNASMN